MAVPAGGLDVSLADCFATNIYGFGTAEADAIAIPGTDWGYLGTRYAFTAPTQGLYRFWCQVTAGASGATTGAMLCAQLGIAHMTSTGDPPGFPRSAFYQTFQMAPVAKLAANPAADADSNISLTVEYSGFCSVGDIVVPFMNDMNPAAGPTTHFVPSGDGSCGFSGFYLGSGA